MPRIEALESESSDPRGGLTHQAIEDYLKTIYMLAQIESPVTTSQLAEAREVKPGSVTGMLKRLASLNLVNYTKHQGVTLTPSGEKIALEVVRHHRLIETFLIEALGFTWDEVHEQADVLEHFISEKLEERIAAALDYPAFDPHGAPIPTKEGIMPELQTVPLTGLEVGERRIVSRIREDEDAEMLRYLADRGLRPGAEIEILAVEPFKGPLTILIDGQEQIVGRHVALAILMRQDE